MRRVDREIQDRSEMLEIIEKADVCHLALADDEGPYIVAMNFGYQWADGELTLYFHSARSGKKIDIITNNNMGCFSVDVDHELTTGPQGCDWSMNYKSVVGRGHLEVLEDDAEKQLGLSLIMKHYSGRDDFVFDEKIFSMTLVLKMTINELTGKKKVE